MELDEYKPALEEEIGEIVSVKEYNPGVYYIEANTGGQFLREYYVVLDTAPMAEKIQNYGKKLDGLRLFPVEDSSSGWRIVQYEVSKYSITVKGKLVPEGLFQDMSLHAMEEHPEYFGTFPVPYYTPDGYTLRYRTLANGIYWLETSKAKELLAVCSTIWNAELSTAALTLSKMAEWDRLAGIGKTRGYIFFTKESSAVPIYELMETRREWDGTVIYRPALMNALWKYAPEYAIHLNGGKNQVIGDEILQSLEQAGLEVLPQPEGKGIAGMFPEAGTDFLLLK